MMVRLINSGLDLQVAHAVARSGDLGYTPGSGLSHEISSGVWLLVDVDWHA